MFPWIYEFQWSAGHLIFLGLFFAVATTVVITLTIASRRSFHVFKTGRQEEIRWRAEFEDLPLVARECRHQLTGEVSRRICHHGLDCRDCAKHPEFLAAAASPPALTDAVAEVCGFRLPLDRYYHRGHTWVRPEGNGIFSIGLDAFAQRLIGTPDGLDLPPAGTAVRTNGDGWIMTKQGARIRVLSPLEGVVTETGGPGSEWTLRVRADDAERATRHLLRGTEVKPWILREVERLQFVLSPESVGLSLADGGEIVPEMWKDMPDVDWDGVWGAMLLQA